MKAKLTLNGKEYEVELNEEQVKEIEKPKYKRWRAEKYKTYCSINSDGTTCMYTDFGDVIDNFLYNTDNYFKTKEEAEFRRQQLLYLQQYKDFLGEDIPTKGDWKDDSKTKYYACYDHHDNFLDISCSFVCEIQGVIYSNSKEKIENFIEEIGEDNFKKYILEVEE